MDAQPEFEALRRESSSWWHTARRKLLREAVAQAIHGKRDARVLDFGCAAQLDFSKGDPIRVLNAYSSLPALAFRQTEAILPAGSPWSRRRRTLSPASASASKALRSPSAWSARMDWKSTPLNPSHLSISY